MSDLYRIGKPEAPEQVGRLVDFGVLIPVSEPLYRIDTSTTIGRLRVVANGRTVGVLVRVGEEDG